MMRHFINIIREAVELTPEQKRAEIMRLYDELPQKFVGPGGGTSSKLQRAAQQAELDKAPDSELDEWLNELRSIIEFIHSNPGRQPQPVEAPKVPVQYMKTLSELASRVSEGFDEWLSDLYDGPGELEAVQADKNQLLEEVGEYLRSEHGISVRDDGLIEFWNLDDDKQQIIGNLPVALFHYTASGVLKSIKKHGLLGDRPTINGTQMRGVYLTTEQSGPAVEGYAAMARQAHGGEVIQVTVKAYLRELQADPDDHDISSGRHQFMVNHVPVERIVGIEKSGL